MEDTLISLETAKIAKEKGFDIKGNQAAWIMNKPSCLDLPTQSVLQKWLREVYDVHVRVDNVNVPNPNKWYYEIQKLPSGVIHLWSKDIDVQNTYEEALEEGLLNALKTIK